MKLKTPALWEQRQGLGNDSGESNSSTKPKSFNHAKTLQAIADKWVNRGCYSTSDRALRALIEDML